jgi:hypothetical protein
MLSALIFHGVIMTEDYIDEAIASAAANAQPEAQQVAIEPIAPDEGADQTSEEEQQKQAAKNDEDSKPFPKKAVNAITRRDRQIGKLRAEQQQYQTRLRELEAKYQGSETGQKKPESSAPNEDDYDNYGEYIKASAKHEARHELEQQFAKQQKTTQEQQQTAAQEAWIEQRSDALANATTDVFKENPALTQLVQENLDIIESIPPHVEMAFLHIEPIEAVQASLALIKEGKMESLFNMPPARAAAEIGRAIDRGAAILKSNTISKAPKPIAANRGTGSSGKSIESMSAEELLKSIRR